jgi:CPA1 family monovalent cation:H+ antiporter
MFSRGHLSEQAYRDLTHLLQLQNESIRHFGRLPDYTLHSPCDRTSMDSFRNARDRILVFTGLPERWRINRTSRDYEEAWGRYQGSNEILADFDRLADADSSPAEVSRKVRDYYRSWNTGSKHIIDITAGHFPEFVGLMQERLARRMMIAEERLTIEQEQQAGIIPSGVAESLVNPFTRAIRQLRGADVSDLRTDPRELLRKVPFFLQTPDQEFDKILPLLKSHTVPAGELIVKQGEHGSSMYLISRGVIRVVRSDGDSEKELASLLPGDFFGEIALLHDEPRTASCRAITPCVLYELTRADIVKIAEVAPSIKSALHEADKIRKQSLEMDAET